MRPVSRKCLKASAPYILIILYSIFGGLIFQSLEWKNELALMKAEKAKLAEAREVMTSDLKQIVLIGHALPNWDSEGQIRKVVEKYEQSIGFHFQEQLRWNFLNSIFYAGTIYTSIGYGHLYCKTVAGQFATIIYAIFGIPLALTTLNHLGIALLKLLRKLDHAVSSLSCWSRICPRRFRNQDAASKRGIASATGRVGAIGMLAGIGLPSTRYSQPGQPMAKARADPLTRKLIRRADDQSAAVAADPECPEDPREPDGQDFRLALLPRRHMGDRFEQLREQLRHEPPVLAALLATISWLFLCAGIFCIWESNWTYWKSFYFFFISMSTIGLGDIVPDHPEYMIMNFGLVLTGLALVSVCITVVQAKLQDMYMALLHLILSEYLKEIELGHSNENATLGMVQKWNSSPKATWLMPLLSKDKRQATMQEFQERAKAQGIELPAVLQHVDRDSGLPPIFNVDIQIETSSFTKDIERQIRSLLGVKDKETQNEAVSPPPLSEKTTVITTTPPPPTTTTSGTDAKPTMATAIGTSTDARSGVSTGTDSIGSMLATSPVSAGVSTGTGTCDVITEGPTKRSSASATMTTSMTTMLPLQSGAVAPGKAALGSVKINKKSMDSALAIISQLRLAAEGLNNPNDAAVQTTMIKLNSASTQTSQKHQAVSSVTPENAEKALVSLLSKHFTDNFCQTQDDKETFPPIIKFPRMRREGKRIHTKDESVQIRLVADSHDLFAIFDEKQTQTVELPALFYALLTARRGSDRQRPYASNLRTGLDGGYLNLEPGNIALRSRQLASSGDDGRELRWDRFDGLHGEKRLPVSTLREKFEKAERASATSGK